MSQTGQTPNTHILIFPRKSFYTYILRKYKQKTKNLSKLLKTYKFFQIEAIRNDLSQTNGTSVCLIQQVVSPRSFPITTVSIQPKYRCQWERGVIYISIFTVIEIQSVILSQLILKQVTGYLGLKFCYRTKCTYLGNKYVLKSCKFYIKIILNLYLITI